jgi:uncharacterized membrane protein YcaP (DUF421 family)
MISRILVVFQITGILIPLSGGRSFGLHTPLDNIVTIMIEAVMSRAIIGANLF